MLMNYHIGRLVLSSLCVGDLVRLALGGVRFAGFLLGMSWYVHSVTNTKIRCGEVSVLWEPENPAVILRLHLFILKF